MIVLRKLAPSEVVQAFPRRGQIDLTDYLDAIQSLEEGETAEVELNGMTRRALKRRMGMAAKQLGVSIKWSRLADEDFMIFQLRDVGPKRATVRRAKRNGRAREVRETTREREPAYA